MGTIHLLLLLTFFALHSMIADTRRYSLIVVVCSSQSLVQSVDSVYFVCLFLLITGFTRKYDLLLHRFNVLVCVVKLIFYRNGTQTLCKPS